MEVIKFKFHSMVDVITNSSTVIFTYQDSVKEAKDLVNEMLKISGIDKTADDVFYYGVFLDNYDRYIESEETDFFDDLGYEERLKKCEELVIQVMKGEIEKPEWMKEAEIDQYGDSWDPDRELHLFPKDDKYKDFGNKIKALLNSVSADGGRDG